MDTEQRYLRDIRDAIKGVEKRSAMQTNGNEKAKYLKDIADAIRENGGGGQAASDILVVGMSYGNIGDFKTLGYEINYTYNFTQSTGREGSSSPVYLNKTYSEISDALSNGKLVLFYNGNRHITYINTRGVSEPGGRNYIESTTPLCNIGFVDTDICGITSTITVEKPSE